jgi:hypothetical protein
MKYMVRTPWAQLVGGASVTILYHYIDIALISRWSFLHGRPTGSLAKPSATKPGTLLSDRRPDTTFNRLLFGAKISSSYRFINTPFQIENVPPVSTRNTKAFLWRKTGVVVCSYLLLDLINSTADPAISLKYFTPDKVSLLYRMNEASVEELVIRAFTTLAAGISLNCVQGGMYNLFGLLSVGLGLSTPKEWPPFYGSLREAYTLRNFWE